MTLQGKGFFTYILPECEGGKPADILAAAQAAGLSHVLVKIANGVYPFGVDASGDYTAPVVQALRGAGITVWGWHYVYGSNPAIEASIAIQRVQTLGLDGYVVDAEEEYKQPGKDNAARQFMTAVRSTLTCPIALSSYRFPNYHPELPWSVFLEFCDLHMPQVYWEQSHNAGNQLRESKRQCDALPNAKPYLPTGAAYGTPPVWDPTPADVTDFLNTAQALGLPAVNFFSWDECRRDEPQVWQTVASFNWAAPVKVTAGTLTPPPTTAPSDGTQPSNSQPAASALASSGSPSEPTTSQPPTGTVSPAGTTSSAGTTSPSSGITPAPATTPPVTTTVTASGQTPLAPPDGYTGQYLVALNGRQAGKAAALYQADAVFVRGGNVIQGLDAIQADYAAFFAGLPAGDFTLNTAKLDSDVRYITWQLGALTGVTTLIWNAGRIASHYIFIE